MSKRTVEIKEEIEKLSERVIMLRNELREIEGIEKLPNLSKKYLGKYFKYRNSYSCPENENDYWFVYSHIVGISNDCDLIVNSFQTDKYGKITIQIKKEIPESVIGVPCTPKEFILQYEKMLKNIKEIEINMKEV